MSTQCVINLDLADVWDKRGRKSLRRTLAWGDEITVTDQKAPIWKLRSPASRPLPTAA